MAIFQKGVCNFYRCQYSYRTQKPPRRALLDPSSRSHCQFFGISYYLPTIDDIPAFASHKSYVDIAPFKAERNAASTDAVENIADFHYNIEVKAQSFTGHMLYHIKPVSSRFGSSQGISDSKNRETHGITAFLEAVKLADYLNEHLVSALAVVRYGDGRKMNTADINSLYHDARSLGIISTSADADNNAENDVGCQKYPVQRYFK